MFINRSVLGTVIPVPVWFPGAVCGKRIVQEKRMARGIILIRKVSEGRWRSTASRSWSSEINPSTPHPKGVGLLRVDPERCRKGQHCSFLKNRSLKLKPKLLTSGTPWRGRWVLFILRPHLSWLNLICGVKGWGGLFQVLVFTNSKSP